MKIIKYFNEISGTDKKNIKIMKMFDHFYNSCVMFLKTSLFLIFHQIVILDSRVEE